ncbi:MAG: DUF5301 domain-containing protein [Clostridia bacterium]|nr:DUF5301 domain-containing protein [Clostridia bacterium]
MKLGIFMFIAAILCPTIMIVTGLIFKKSALKKIVLPIIVIVILAGLILGGYFVINSLFPKAAPINVPSAKSVISMTVAKNEMGKAGEPRKIANTDIESILSQLSDAEPTREMSVQDSPDAQTYYEIVVETSERTHYFYVYFENGTCYVEILYEGVYTIDNGLVNLLPTGDYRIDEKVKIINTESDIDAEELKAHYDNGGIIVVRDWQLANDVETIVRGIESREHDEKDLATVFCKSKSGAPYTGVVKGNTSDLEGEIDEMVANAKATQ